MNVTIGPQPEEQPMTATQTFRIPSSEAGTNASLVKAGAGIIVSVTGYNERQGPCYLKLYDKATVPLVGSDAPFITEYLDARARFSVDFSGTPMAFSQGLGVAFTVGPEDDDNTGTQTGEIKGVNITYA